jgi:hypothetical protein
MGTVEVAIERGADGFERIVALKRLLPEGARNPRHKEMFWREARLAALLAHPNVVHAFAFGELYGELFLAMEYVAGEPLSRVLSAAHRDERGLDAGLVAYVLAEACDGLHAAHELRDVGGRPLHVVHRDVSPHNVMIAYGGDVKILDFGVAKFEQGGSTQTRTGEVKGKMAYMSPEQALGEKLDRRSDLFSVGAVLFECLAGRRMWGPGTDLEVMRKLALDPPPRLDEAVPGTPPALVRLHGRLVARDPGKRPATAREVAEHLRTFAASSAPTASAEGVRALMTRLFKAEAEQGRAELGEALARAAPSQIEALRRSLEPGAALERPTLMDPVIVRRPDEEPAPATLLAAEPRPPQRSRSLAMIVLGLVAVIAAALAVSAARRSPGTAPTAQTGPPPATATPTPTATPTVRSRTPKPPHAKLPDVDPTPF